MTSYAEASILFIKKLIHIQQHIPPRYLRNDQKTVNDCIRKLKPLVENNHYTDNQAKMFWIEKRWMIRVLFPSNHYPGYAKLFREFIELDVTEEMLESVENTLKK